MERGETSSANQNPQRSILVEACARVINFDTMKVDTRARARISISLIIRQARVITGRSVMSGVR